MPADGTVVIQSGENLHTFRVELANTPATRSRGLMHRREMARDAGMLFDFVREQRVAMWMKNTFISLDMLFIDAAGRITNIASRTMPHSEDHLYSRGPVQAVLEINGGLASKLGIQAGDRVRHGIFKPVYPVK